MVLSPIQRCLTECGVSEYVHETSTVRMPWPTRTVELSKKKYCTDDLYLLLVYVKHNGVFTNSRARSEPGGTR